MTAHPDPYRTLGVAPRASAEEVARAYRGMVRRHHPDSRDPAGDGAEHDRALGEVMAAYATLRDTASRDSAYRDTASRDTPAETAPAGAGADVMRVRVRRSDGSSAGRQRRGAPSPPIVVGPTWYVTAAGDWRVEPSSRRRLL